MDPSLQHAVAQRPFVLPAGATEILLIRHGAMDLAAAQPAPHGTVGDRPLSELGLRQAEAVAERLESEAVSIFTSPMRRARESALVLAERHSAQPTTVDEWREVHLGDWEAPGASRLADPADPITRAVFTQERWDLIPGAEPAAAFAQRVRAAVGRLLELIEPGSVPAVFTHGGVIGEICAQATGSRRFAFVGADNGSISGLMVMDDGTWILRGFNDIGHLGTIHKSPAPTRRQVPAPARRD